LLVGLRGADAEGRVVRGVRERAQDACDSGQRAVAVAVRVEQRRTLGDGHLDDGDLLDASLFAQAAAPRGTQVARPVALAPVRMMYRSPSYSITTSGVVCQRPVRRPGTDSFEISDRRKSGASRFPMCRCIQGGFR
jgi:hypothetical protein